MMLPSCAPFTVVLLLLLLDQTVASRASAKCFRHLPFRIDSAIPTCNFDRQNILLGDAIAGRIPTSATTKSLFLHQIRGGGDVGSSKKDEEEEDEEGEDDATADETEGEGSGTEVDQNAADDAVVDLPKMVVGTITKLTLDTTTAVMRVIQAAFQGDAQENESGALDRILNMFRRMYDAAFTKPTDVPISTTAAENANESVSWNPTTPAVTTTTDDKKIKSLSEGSPSDTRYDFGRLLSKAYGVSDERKRKSVMFLGGSLADALQIARSQARLLVVFIPSSPPPKSKHGSTTTTTTNADQEALQSLLSKKVAAMAQRKARKDEPYGSFVIWGAKAGSPEAAAALKRLKVKVTDSKGNKRPVLLVAYANQVLSSAYELKLVPLLLAQHHCSPPPAAEAMAAWLKALRKRHAKEYIVMQTSLRELKFYQERQEGYRESMSLDAQRQENERKLQAERVAREKAEQERIQAIEQRRKELQSSLPAEPGSDIKDAVTIALRFADGRTGQRRFAPETLLEAVFNWVDAMFDMERETVTLATMNGQKTFLWKDCGQQTLADAGIGRMTGLRVLQAKPETPPPQPASSTS